MLKVDIHVNEFLLFLFYNQVSINNEIKIQALKFQKTIMH